MPNYQADFTKIEDGLYTLLKKDGYLLKNSVNERSITHKLAEYYQVLFPEWNVDCEYNLNLGGPKTIKIDPRQLLSRMAAQLKNDFQAHGIEVKDLPTKEEILNLKEQLLNPRIDYIAELDLYVFVLKMNGKTEKLTIYPDIIMHHRGVKENHIVIEAKKTKNGRKIARYYDLLKLATLVSDPEYQYEMGLFIELPVKKRFDRFRTFRRRNSLFFGVFKYLPE